MLASESDAPWHASARDVEQFPALQIGTCLFCLSLATALFALLLFKLTSFYILPSALFDLLFIGFPIGALIGARFLRPEVAAWRASLWGLQAVMVATVTATLFAKHFDYLRANLFDVTLTRLLVQIAIFAAGLLPFFAAYGLTEYLGYRVGYATLGGRMRLVYGLYLLGAAAAYVSVNALVATLGVARLLVASFALIGLATYLLAPRPGRSWAAAEIAVCVLVGFLPIDPVFLAMYKGRGDQSTWQYRHYLGCRPLFQRWGRYSLCEILASPDRRNFYGFYNDMLQWEYSPQMGFESYSIGAAPIVMVRHAGPVLIVGSGGGRQVRFASRMGVPRIVAIEIEPAVFDAARGARHLRYAFDRVYDVPGIVPICGEARSYLERTNERFDLIYLPSVGGYPQMMLEPGNMIRTREAYRTMCQRLTPGGLIAIWYPVGLDAKAILTEQYVRTLRELGMTVRAYANTFEFLILASRNGEREIPSAELLLHTLLPPASIQEWQRVAPTDWKRFEVRELAVADDPSFRAVTDDRPYLAANNRYILSTGQVLVLFGICALTLGVAGLVPVFGLPRLFDPQIPGRPFLGIAVLAVSIGANFLMLEHALVLAIFRRFYVFHDALMMGAIAFLMITALGSMAAGGRFRTALTILAACGVVVLIAFAPRLPFVAVVCLLLPAILLSGTFFPDLLKLAAHRPVGILALDAIGAGLGALLATFLPILMAFDAFYVLAGVTFLVTVVAWSRIQTSQ